MIVKCVLEEMFFARVLRKCVTGQTLKKQAAMPTRSSLFLLLHFSNFIGLNLFD